MPKGVENELIEYQSKCHPHRMYMPLDFNGRRVPLSLSINEASKEASKKKNKFAGRLTSFFRVIISNRGFALENKEKENNG